MTRRTLGLAWCLACAALTAAAPDPPPPQIFRAAADATSINVSVRDRNRPVAGLTADDFQVLDNGVLQQISSVALETVPIDLTLVLDTSGSVAGPALERLRQDVREVSGFLGPGDRLRFLSFSTTVKEVFGMQPRETAPIDAPVAASGATAFFNALTAALLPEATPGRPHLIIALTDGGDNVSLLDPKDVRDMARRSEAVLHILIRGGDFHATGWGHGWLPFMAQRRDLDVLRDAASLTGGRYEEVSVGKSAAALFKTAVEEFKTSYVLWYRPAGVPREGWHDLTVRLKSGKYTVLARRGYFGG